MSILKSIYVILFLFCTIQLSGQFTNWRSTITAEKSQNENHIELKWAEEDQTTFTVDRKALGSITWNTLSVDQSENFYIDTDTEIGEAFEYKVFRNHSDGSSEYYFIYAGIEVPANANRGNLLLLVENDIASALPAKVERWIDDAQGDGWQVTQVTVDRSESVDQVKSIIRQAYYSDDGLKSVFLLGHVPVPYSGLIAPDGHGNHEGAWASDYYYADMNDVWTDVSVNVSAGVFAMTSNVPGDGKFDQSRMDGAEIEVGRVDFNALPVFSKTEIELTEFYLDKNHAFKNKHFTPANKALVYNTFSSGFHANGDLNIPTIVGVDNYEYLPYKQGLIDNDYLWAFGSGGGSFTSAQNVITSADFAADSLKTVFNVLFGSYFGDFDATNNLMRASLGSGNILSVHWGSRPNWVYFHMGLGVNMGLPTRLSLSDVGVYNGISRWGNVHCALLGDPTLRSHMVAPVQDLTVSNVDNNVSISWAYPESNEGTTFYLYVKSNQDTEYQLLTTVDYDTLDYTYVEESRCGETEYMVRSQKLQSTPSGSYYNQGIGKRSTIILPVTDQDSDGYCTYEDCDDTNPDVNVEQVELPNNGIDDNCNGLVDEQDLDQDGYFDVEDCNDEVASINPLAIEIPNNGIDENCDGLDDFDLSCISAVAYTADDTTFFTQLFNCDALPFTVNEVGVFPKTSYIIPAVSQSQTFNISFCDGYDEENWVGLISAYYYTQFSNVPTIGDHIKTVSGCSMNLRFESVGLYSGILLMINDARICVEPPSSIANGLLVISCVDDNDGDEYIASEDCDDDNPDVNPGATEIIYNGIDDDCNPMTLDDDLDQDGYPLAEDCDDTNAEINPGAEEIPNNGIDEDCDGIDLLTSTYTVQEFEVKVYPNPAVDVIIVEVEQHLNFETRIYSLTGKLLLRRDNTSVIEVSTIPSGVYLLEVKDLDTGQSVVQRIVVAK